MAVSEGFGKTLGQAAIVGGVVLAIYLYLRSKLPGSEFANQVKDDLTTPANQKFLTGTTDSLWNWWTGATKDYGTGPQSAAGPLSGDENRSVISVQLERWFPWLFGSKDTPVVPVSDTAPAWVDAGLLPGGESVSGLPGAAGSLTEANLAANRALFNQLPTSYSQIEKFDIVKDSTKPDYESGNLRMFISPEGWGVDQWQKHSWGWEWTNITMSAGSSPAVWHTPVFKSYLQQFGVI